LLDESSNIVDPSSISSSRGPVAGRRDQHYPEAMARPEPQRMLDSFSRVARRLRAAAARSYATFEVGSTQAKFLRELGQAAPLTQAELARKTVTDEALTGRVLQTLIERGWVQRKRSRDDRRKYLLELSAAGERARARVDSARRKLSRRMQATLDQRDLNDFERIAGKLLAAFPAPDDDS
jgi:DNA-binding MarR family transcriptional regulator